MTAEEKLAKATRIQPKLIERGIEADFAEAMALCMVMTGCYKVNTTRMRTFFAGPNGADKFRAAINAGQSRID